MLQETHSVAEDLERWQNELEYKTFLNSGKSNARGCLISFSNKLDFEILKYYDDGNGRLQVVSCKIENVLFLLVNIYNFNYEKEQLALLKDLDKKLTEFNSSLDHKVIIGGDWNFVLNKELDSFGCKQPPKLKSIAELAKISETHQLSDIFRIRYPNEKSYTFRATRPLRRTRLDYFLVSNTFHEAIDKCTVLNSVSSDHNPIFISIKLLQECTKSTAYWKLNCSLLNKNEFITDLKNEIEKMKTDLAGFEPQIKWELIKYKIRAFCRKFSKKIAKEKKEKMTKLENIIKNYETTPEASDENYLASKLEYETILNLQTSGHILRSKTKIFEENEKSSKYFLSLERRNAIQNTIKMLIKDPENADDKITEPKMISKEIRNFYSKLFKKMGTKTNSECLEFLNNIDLPMVSDELNEILKKPLSLSEIEDAIKSSVSGKSPGNDGLGREFYIIFWKNISQPLYESFLDGFKNGILSTSQRQAVIKLLEKKGKDKRFISNWRPISLINYDAKLLSKCLAKRLKAVLPSIIKSDQTAYVANRFLGESVRQISDILEITKTLNIGAFLMTVDI